MATIQFWDTTACQERLHQAPGRAADHRAWDRADTDDKRRFVANLVSNASGTQLTSDDVIRLFIDWLDAPTREQGAGVRGEEQMSVHNEVARGQQKPVVSQNWIVANLTLLRGSSSSEVRQVFDAARADRDRGARWQPR